MNRFERFLKNASVRTDETASGRILKMMNDAYGPSARTHGAGRLVRYGVAAAILIGVGVVATQMGPFKAGVAWGRVAERVGAEDTFMFSLAIDVSDPNIVKAADQPQARFTFYLSERYGFRMDISGGGQTVSWYVPPQGDTLTMVAPSAKTWTRSPLPAEQRGKMPDNYEDPADYIKRFLARPQKELGRSVIDGVPVEGIEVTDPPMKGQKLDDAVGRLWVDSRTELPIRIEIEGKAGGKLARWQTDFRWAEAVSPSAFEPNIPPDYTRVGQ
jgi:hypothetical protein